MNRPVGVDLHDVWAMRPVATEDDAVGCLGSSRLNCGRTRREHSYRHEESAHLRIILRRCPQRQRDAALDGGDVLVDGGESYRVVRVEQPKSVRSFGHAWTTLIGGD